MSRSVCVPGEWRGGPLAWILVASVGVAACGDDGISVPDAGEEPRIIVPATHVDYRLPFTFDADGFGSQAIAGISVDGSVGTIGVLAEQLPILVFSWGPWPEAGVNVYQGLIVAADRWYTSFFYCREGRFWSVWLEGTDSFPLGSELARGDCVRAAGAVTRSVDFPAVDMAYPKLEPGYTFSGDSLRYDGVHPGLVRLGGVDMVLLPFESVDCSQCPGGGGEGWQELHALIYDPGAQRACIGIFYMEVPGTITMAYTITLPDLSDPGGARFTADWETP